MVRFTETGFTIEVNTGTNPIEDWLNTHSELIDLLQSENEEMHAYRGHCLELIRNMMPDWQTAKKMAQ